MPEKTNKYRKECLNTESYSRIPIKTLGIILLLGLFFPLVPSLQGGAIKGVVYRRANYGETLVINRYAGQPDVSQGQSQLDFNQAVVYLKSETPLLLKSPDKHLQMEQINKTFRPWLLSVTVGTTVDFPNNDPIFHNVFSYSKTKIFDLGRYGQGKYKSVTFDKTGLVNVFCEIHNEMRAYIMVLDTPHHTVTDEQGAFLLENIPAGKYTLHVWQENLPEYEVEINIFEHEQSKIDIR